MKKLFFYASFALASIIVFSSCMKDDLQDNNKPEQSGAVEGLNFTLKLSAGTKTTLEGMSTKWVEGDKVNIFHAEAGTDAYVSDGAFEITDAANGVAEGTLGSSLAADKSYDWYVVYPYNENSTSPTEISISIPTEQVQAETGSMAHICGNLDPLHGKATGVAASEMPTVTMKHLLTVVKVRARNYNYETLSLETVSLSAKQTNGGADVNLAGTYTVNVAGDTPSFTAVSAVARPYVRFTTPASLGTNDFAYAYVATVPFQIEHAGEYTVGMNNTEGGVTMALYETNGGLVQFNAGKITEVRQGTIPEPPFKDGIKFYRGMLKNGVYTKDDWDAWRVELPVEYQLAGEFNFKDLFYSCNIGDAKVTGAADGNGGSNVSGKGFDAGIVNEGTAQNFYWRWNKRIGHNFEDSWFAGSQCPDYKHGLLMTIYPGYRVCAGGYLMWVRMADPLEGLTTPDPNDGNIIGISCPSLVTSVTGWASAPNYAVASHAAGETKDIVTDFIAQNAGWSGDANPLFTAAWNALDIKDAAGNTLIHTPAPDEHIAMTETLEKYCNYSKGLYWKQTWYNYEPAWADGGMNEDGVNAAAAKGISVTEDGKIVATDAFNPSVDGGYRITSRVCLDTDYGTYHFIGARWMVMTTYHVGL